MRKLAGEPEAFDVVLAGGVFHSRSRLLIDALKEQVHRYAPEARVALLEAPPIAGSVPLAFDAAGISTLPALLARLPEEARLWRQARGETKWPRLH